MKIIELSQNQFRNYAKLHSYRNIFQTIEYANIISKYNQVLLGFTNEETNTIMGATLILEKQVGKYKYGLIPGGFLIDYNNEKLLKDFVTSLKSYLKKDKYIYLEVDNKAVYKITNKYGKVIYFDTNIKKTLDKLSFYKSKKSINREVILEASDNAEETFKNFNSNTKRNIKKALNRAITVYKDEDNNINILTNLNKNLNYKKLENIINNFNDENNVKAEIYFAKISPTKYVNNYRYLLQKEDEENDNLNNLIQNIDIIKTAALISRKMISDNKKNKYNKEIIKATNILSEFRNDTIIGAILIIKNNREIYFSYEAYNEKLKDFYSSHLIKWEIIKKYSKEGYKIFNFGNVLEVNNKNGEYNFKIGFGGKIYESIGNYDLVINKLLYPYAKIKK